MKALVTGAAGFIGFHLARALIDKGYTVRGLLLPQESDSELTKLGVEIFRGDLTDPSSLKGVADNMDLVFHLATRTSDWGSFKQFKSIMVDGTRNLLEASKDSISRFIYYSSIAALGLNRASVGLDESAERLKCGIPYCDTKIIAEDLVKDFCNSRSLEYTIIRPANVFGPGSVWVKDILDAFKKGPLPLINGGKEPGAFIYVDNLIDGTILAAESEKANGKIYHLRDDYPITWGEYLKILSGWIGEKPKGNFSFRTVWILGGILEKILTPFGIRPPLTRLAAGVMGLNNDVKNQAAKSDLGWESRVSLSNAMNNIKDWVQQNY